MFDPHWPYEPPEPYASEHEGRPYDGEIAFADAQLGRLLEWWDAELERSVVMVTADHGEGMGDGGERTHGFLLHDGTIRVPMIARGHGFPQGEVSEDPVSHVDLAPTMLAIAGLPTDERLVGRDMRQGGSDQVYSEATTGQFNLGLSSLTSLTDERGRFTEGGWQGWYPVKRNRVAVVPQETTDLPILAERMEELRTRLGDHQAPVTSLQPEELEQLQALGYIGGDPLAESGPVDPRDVIDLMPLTWAARRAMGQGELERAEQMIARLEARLPGTFGVDLLSAQLLRTQGEVTEAIERYTDLYLRSPGGTVSLHLASMYASSGDWEAAEDWFRTTLEHQANSPEAMAGLVRCALARGEPVQAEMLADQYLEIYPDHAELVLLAVRVKIDLGQPGPQLLGAARQALERLSRSAWAYTQVSHVAWQTGEAELAIELAQEALRIDPMGWGARVELARMLLEVGRAAEASRVLAPAVRSAPEFTELQQLYGQALAAVQAQVTESGPADGP
jgi:tetratricopeptide (TPR) repeat protein